MSLAELIININKLRVCFEGEPRINAASSPESLVEVKAEWKRHFDTLDTLKPETSENMELIEQAIRDAKVKIVLSFCTKEFISQYGPEFSYDDESALVEEVTNIIGEVDQADVKVRLQEKFDSMSRRVETAEKFGAFLKRLTNVASKLTKEQATQKYIVDAQFRKSLSPAEREFIVIHGDPESSSDAQATLLDEKKQNLVSRVNQIKQNRIDELEMTMSEAMSESGQLRSTIDALRKQVEKGEKRHAEQSARINELQASVSQLNKPRASHNRPQPYPRPSQFRRQPYRGPRCDDCGMAKHDGPCSCKEVCFKCQKVGHLSYSKKFHPPKNE